MDTKRTPKWPVFDQQIVDYVPARYRPGHLHRLMVSLERAVGGTSTDLAVPLEQVALTVRKRGMVVLISDLLYAAADPRISLEERRGWR